MNLALILKKPHTCQNQDKKVPRSRAPCTKTGSSAPSTTPSSPFPGQPAGTRGRAAWWQSCPPSSPATETPCTAPSGCSRRRAQSASRRPQTGRYEQPGAGGAGSGEQQRHTVPHRDCLLHFIIKWSNSVMCVEHQPKGTEGQAVKPALLRPSASQPRLLWRPLASPSASRLSVHIRSRRVRLGTLPAHLAR